MIRPATAADVDGLAEVLLDAIAGVASVSFMAGFSREQAMQYWRKALSDPLRLVLVAGDCDGTATLVLDTPPNQPHRADLAKMLVHRRAQRRGLGRVLFDAICDEARRRGRTLLTFDTMSGSAAERLYLSCGCVKVGEIPRYALWPDGSGPDPTSIFYKRL